MGERVRNRDAFVDVQFVAFFVLHLERGLLGLGVIGYQYILLITEIKALADVSLCPAVF